ncbi:uncharacterized protein LOC144656163 isoform X2 [Oculina patagonica]
MKVNTALAWLIAAYFIQGLIGLPIDRELLRVKRKGEGEFDNGEELVRKVRRSQDDKETEIRHKRRFFATETTEHETQDGYKTKMEARSSRSSREDNDITAKRPERFRLRIHKRSHDESSLIKGDDISGSGERPEPGSSGSGLWSGPQLDTKRTDKRSMNSNSLDSLIATLQAISSLTPEENDNSDEEIESSGSGIWLAPENEVDDKLPQFFKEEANSGSGENPEKALTMLSEKAQMELGKHTEDVSSGLAQNKPNVGSEETHEQEAGKMFRREVKSDALADDLIAATENEDKDDNSEQGEHLSSSSGSADDEQENEDKIPDQPEDDKITEPEVKTTRSLADALLPDAFYRTKRSSQENTWLVSDNIDLGENDALISNSLVARFYRDQDAFADAPEASVASLPSEIEKSPGKQGKPVKRESHYDHSGDFSEPRVVYTREVSDAREPIIERPAVYSQSKDESEMDSSFGGEDDDDDDATLMIHERDIREDGYVGCYEDKSPDRDLPTILSVSHLTPDSCRSACQGAGHAYAGVQYGYLCRCGDSYGKYTKVSDEECNALCVGDRSQKCGGFWRSAVFTTAGAMQPSKRGNFFHIESVQPMTEEIFDIPRSEIASGDDDSKEIQSTTITETSHVSAQAPQAPELPTPVPETTTPESSGAYIQEIHRETSLQESPVPLTPPETTKENDSAAQPSGEEPTPEKADASTPHAPESEPANNPAPVPAHTPEIKSAPTISSHPPSHDSLPAATTSTSDSLVVTNEQPPEVARPQHDQAPQGTHGSQLMYLHQQQDILSKPTPKTIIAVAPGKVKAGTIAYTGTIKLKQSWLDQFEDGNSAESKILTGNIEQAFKRVFKNEPKFVNAEVVGFREGLVKHNPNTIRKVIAPFILTFKNGVKGIEEKLKNMVHNLGRLDDMPVYKDSLQLAEYGHSPTAEKAKSVNEMSKVKHEDEDEKRSAVNVPNGGVDPYLKGIFSQIST